jgi:hypothetical protein
VFCVLICVVGSRGVPLSAQYRGRVGVARGSGRVSYLTAKR